MPLQNIPTATGGTSGYCDPFVGRPGPPAHVKVDLSGLTTDEVDPDGYLKPGVPLTKTGVLPAGTGAIAWGVVPEATRLNLVTIPPTNTTLGTETGDHFVGVFCGGLLNLDIIEDNLGRALTADEKAALETNAGAHFVLTST